MPFGYKSNFGEDSVWGEVAALTAEDHLRLVDQYFDVKISSGRDLLASDLAKMLHTLSDSRPSKSIDIAPQALFEVLDDNDNLAAVELDLDNSDSHAFSDSDSGLSSPASECSLPGSPLLPPVELEIQIETAATWESELFGGVLPALVSKAVDLVLDPAMMAASLPELELSSSLVQFDCDVSSSLKNKRKQAPSKPSPRIRTKRGKFDNSDSSETVSPIETSSPSVSSPAPSSPPSSSDSTSQKLRSPTKRKASTERFDAFKSEQVLKISSKAAGTEEEDVDID